MPQRIEVPGMGIVEFPDGMSDDQIASAIKASMQKPQAQMPRELGGMLPAGGTDMLLQELKNSMPGQSVLGALSGASRIGNTLLRAAGQGDDQRSAMLQDWRDQNVTSTTGKVADVGAQVAGTAGVGGLLGKGVAALAPRATPLIEALATGGFKAGGLPGVGGMATRMLGGAAAGGASAALVDPSTADTGAMIGGALPVAARAAGVVGQGVGAGLRKMAGEVSPEVSDLATRAKQLGIDVPADRLVQSKPLDAVASGLNYIPFSGRAATESKMNEQLNQALSRTFGQNTSNVTQALRKAESSLGSQFDNFLQSNSVNVDQQFLADIADAANKASRELGSDGASIIGKQVDDIIAKAGSGQIDGQAAYNIKKTLDRIGRRNSPEAWYALDLKQKLMDALNRSVGPQKAQEFGQLREQYSNMLSLQKLAKNGVEGELSVARIANLPNINNPRLQEVADIAAQFVRPREAQHGAMQRAVVGLGAGSLGGATLGIPGIIGAAGVSGAARGVNSALQSEALRDLLMRNKPAADYLLGSPALFRAAPVIGAQ